LHRQGIQKDLVQKGKNRRVGPDSETHGKNHHQAEERRLHQAAKRKPYARHTLN